jgi:hypothetical protein
MEQIDAFHNDIHRCDVSFAQSAAGDYLPENRPLEEKNKIKRWCEMEKGKKKKKIWEVKGKTSRNLSILALTSGMYVLYVTT